MIISNVHNCLINSSGRNRKLENLIYKNVSQSFYYAQNVIKGRWPKAEKFICLNHDFSLHYYENFLPNKINIKKLSKIVLNSEESYYAIIKYVNGRFPKLEKRLLNSGVSSFLYIINYVKNPSYMVNYLNKEKLSEVHYEFVEDYLSFLKKHKKRFFKLEQLVFEDNFKFKDESSNIVKNKYLKNILRFNHD